jgi:2-(1,2-epoxy-1,2-dihydrophenyl)acetyl-CoA isomerase
MVSSVWAVVAANLPSGEDGGLRQAAEERGTSRRKIRTAGHAKRREEDHVSPPIILSVRDGIAKLVLNRPENGNAVDDELREGLIAAVAELAAEQTVRTVLLTATGPKFCVGGDIGLMRSMGGSLREFIQRTIVPAHAAILQLVTLPVPIVTAVTGPAGGGGVALALCGDVVLGASSMKLRAGYSAIGLTPDLGTSYFLTRRAGAARAKRVLLLNESVSARECVEWGLADAIYADDRLMTEAESFVQRLASGPTRALARIKRLIDGDPASLEAHLANERDAMIASAGTEDAREGLAAFIEGRRPHFRGV